MSATVTLDTDGRRNPPGGPYGRYGTLNVGVYATSGIAVTKAMFDLWSSLDDLNVRPSGGYVPVWDKTNAKVIVYCQSDVDNDLPMEQVPNATDLTSTEFRFRAEGR